MSFAAPLSGEANDTKSAPTMELVEGLEPTTC